MDNARITIPLEQAERSALMKWATAELREPRDQIRFILRQRLIEMGYLQPAPTPTKKESDLERQFS